MASIRLNLHSLIVQRRLAETNSLLGKSMERLSTGLRVRTANDSPGEYGMIVDMNRQVRAIQQGQNNAQNALGMLQATHGAVQQIDDALQRMHDLAVEAADSTLTDAQRQSLHDELIELRQGIEDVVESTKYNNVKLLSERFEAAQIEGGTIDIANGPTITASTAATIQSDDSYSFTGGTLDADVNFDLYIGALDVDLTPNETQPNLNKLNVVIQSGMSTTQAATKLEETIEKLGGQYSEGGALHISVTTVDQGGGVYKFQLATTETGANMKLAAKGIDPNAGTSTFINSYTEVTGVTNNDKLTIKVDGEKIKATIGDGDYSSKGDTLALAIRDAINNKLKYGSMTVSFDDTISGSEHLILTSDTIGYRSGIEIVDGSTTLLGDLGLAKGQSDVGDGSNFEFQIGGAGDQFTFTLEQLGLHNLGGMYGNVSDPGVDITTLRIDSQASANDAVAVLEDAIAQLGTAQTRLGTASTNLQRRINILQTNEENLVAQRSLVQDVDFTEETRDFSRLQILLQAGTVALAQANLLPSTLLTLLQ